MKGKRKRKKEIDEELLIEKLTTFISINLNRGCPLMTSRFKDFVTIVLKPLRLYFNEKRDDVGRGVKKLSNIA